MKKRSILFGATAFALSACSHFNTQNSAENLPSEEIVEVQSVDQMPPSEQHRAIMHVNYSVCHMKQSVYSGTITLGVDFSNKEGTAFVPNKQFELLFPLLVQEYLSKAAQDDLTRLSISNEAKLMKDIEEGSFELMTQKEKQTIISDIRRQLEGNDALGIKVDAIAIGESELVRETPNPILCPTQRLYAA